MSRVRAASAAALVVLACAAVTGCGRGPAGPAGGVSIDLLALAREAQKRPQSSDPSVYSVREVVIGAVAKRALIVPQPSRIVWQVRVPAHSRLTGAFGVLQEDGTHPPARGRVYLGISDRRHFAGLLDLELPGQATAARWEPIDVDLGRFGGWQWSLFYRPWETTWDLVATITGPVSGRAALAGLAVVGGR